MGEPGEGGVYKGVSPEDAFANYLVEAEDYDKEEALKAIDEHGFGYYDINEKDDDEDVETGVPVS